MRQITEIDSTPRQRLNLVGENNERISFTLQYRPTQQSWYFDLSYEGFEVYGVKLLNSPNVLRQWINVLPFGISCAVPDGTDPYFVDDFTSERVVVYLLNAEEVQLVESGVLSGQ